MDTFLANGLKLIDEEGTDPSLDVEIMGACLSDPEMHALGERACRPSSTLWDETLLEYSRRRPKWLARELTDPNKWLFD